MASLGAGSHLVLLEIDGESLVGNSEQIVVFRNRLRSCLNHGLEVSVVLGCQGNRQLLPADGGQGFQIWLLQYQGKKLIQGHEAVGELVPGEGGHLFLTIGSTGKLVGGQQDTGTIAGIQGNLPLVLKGEGLPKVHGHLAVQLGGIDKVIEPTVHLVGDEGVQLGSIGELRNVQVRLVEVAFRHGTNGGNPRNSTFLGDTSGKSHRNQQRNNNGYRESFHRLNIRKFEGKS